MESKKGALQGTGRTGRRAREQLSVKDVLLALGGGPHHYPHYPNWAQQCLVTFIIIDHAYADERVCAHDLSLGWFRCRGNIETKSDNFCDAKTNRRQRRLRYVSVLSTDTPGMRRRASVPSSVSFSGSVCTVTENYTFVGS